MNKVFGFNGKIYPNFIADGNHAQYILPVAKKICTGIGIDIGCNRIEWAFPNAPLMCDINLEAPWNDALHIPCETETLDFVFSSHCLEHIPDYYAALKEWSRILKVDGIMFLYLPSIKCDYWRPAHDRKHLHILREDDILYDLESLGFSNIICSGVDMAYSYAIFGQKCN